jgi:hypothetical protein
MALRMHVDFWLLFSLLRHESAMCSQQPTMAFSVVQKHTLVPNQV